MFLPALWRENENFKNVEIKHFLTKNSCATGLTGVDFMQNYKVNILLSDGDEVQSRVAAEDQEAAMKRLKKEPVFIKFLGKRKIVKIDISPESEEPMRKADYVLQKSESQPNHYVVADKENGAVITFEQHRFNETQKITFLDDVILPPVEIASILRKVGEWLRRYHYWVSMPVEQNMMSVPKKNSD